MNRRFFFVTENGNVYVTAWDEVSHTFAQPDPWFADISQLLFEGFEEISTRTANQLGWFMQ